MSVIRANLEELRKAVQSGNTRLVREIIDVYLASEGYHVWWEKGTLVTYASEAKDVVRALRELFDAAGIDAEIVAWPSGGFGPVKIGVSF